MFWVNVFIVRAGPRLPAASPDSACAVGMSIAADILNHVINSYARLDDSEVAIAAARAGADVVRNMYGRRPARIDKGAGDFATAADVEAEKTIFAVIHAARPDDAVLGEEGGQQGAADAARQWLVDPLCGTLNYAVGNMLVAVNVALRNGAAAVADPFSGEVFFADGETAWVRQDETDAPLTPTPATQLVDVNLDPRSRARPDSGPWICWPTLGSSSGSGRASCLRRWRWRGSLPASAPRTSPMAATSPGACTSPPTLLCARLPAASSRGSTAPRSGRQAADLW